MEEEVKGNDGKKNPAITDRNCVKPSGRNPSLCYDLNSLSIVIAGGHLNAKP